MEQPRPGGQGKKIKIMKKKWIYDLEIGIKQGWLDADAIKKEKERRNSRKGMRFVENIFEGSPGRSRARANVLVQTFDIEGEHIPAVHHNRELRKLFQENDVLGFSQYCEKHKIENRVKTSAGGKFIRGKYV